MPTVIGSNKEEFDIKEMQKKGLIKQKHSPEQMAKWEQERRDRDRAKAEAQESERRQAKEAGAMLASSVGTKGISKHFTDEERESVKYYFESGDRHGGHAEARLHAVNAIHRKLQENGVPIHKVSESNEGKSKSIYAMAHDGLVRISDHELPETPARLSNKESGLHGKWNREVIVRDWQNTSMSDYINEINGIEKENQ